MDEKQNLVSSLRFTMHACSPSRQIVGAEVLKKIKSGAINVKDMKDLAKGLDVKLNDFYAIIRELKSKKRDF
jgi:hypothetical protein